jgi:hypothetical protein
MAPVKAAPYPKQSAPLKDILLSHRFLLPAVKSPKESRKNLTVEAYYLTNLHRKIEFHRLIAGSAFAVKTRVFFAMRLSIFKENKNE